MPIRHIWNQGGAASGAAGPTSAPSLALGGPPGARRAPLRPPAVPHGPLLRSRPSLRSNWCPSGTGKTQSSGRCDRRELGSYRVSVENTPVRVGDFTYDVALSFAGEQRSYVQKVASALRRVGIRPFYDDYEQASLWGKDLYEHLDWVYHKAARYCVLFASDAYARKVWTTHERRSAQARALKSNEEYILPARFDDTEIPGLRSTIACVDARSVQPAKLAALIAEKLGPRVHERFLPPEPDRLFAALDATSLKEQRAVEFIVVSFMQTLMRMTLDERRLVAHLFQEGCHTQLPDNVHISLDILRRDLGLTPTAVIENLRAMTSIGFEGEVKSDDDHGDDMLFVRWIDTMTYRDDFTDEFSYESDGGSRQYADSRHG